MNIYFIRHAEASAGYPDVSRKLSDSGIKKLKKSIRIWKNYLPPIDYLFCSPLDRAYQTAKIIHTELLLDCKIIKDKSLLPGSSPENIVELLNSLEADEIVIVGHMPDLANHISFFTSDSNVHIKFYPGTLASIHFNSRSARSSGELMNLIPPLLK